MEPATIADAAGQAAAEFLFILIMLMMVMALLVTFFSFAQGVFADVSRTRAEMLESFHGDIQYAIDGGKTYRPKNQLKVVVRRLPYVGDLIGDVDPYERTVELPGGTAPPFFSHFGPPAECVGAGAVVGLNSKTKIRPGSTVASAVAGGICVVVHAWEYDPKKK